MREEKPMVARGVHFAITDRQRQALEAAADDNRRIDYVREVIEEEWDEDFLQETDKAWDAIHRCLSEFPPHTEWFYPVGEELGPYALPEDHGAYPLRLCVLGGRKLVQDESTYIIRLIEPAETIDLARALDGLDRMWMREKYFRHCEGCWPEFGEDDFDYTWEWFIDLRRFFRRMAGNGRAIIFTTDQ